MSENKPLHLKDIKTKNRVEMIAKNLWGLVTEDRHLLLEIDLTNQTGFTKKSNNRLFTKVVDRDLIMRGPDTDELMNRQFSMTVYGKRICVYCGRKIAADETARHLGLDCHDECWGNYLDAHPELKAQAREEEAKSKGGKDDE